MSKEQIEKERWDIAKIEVKYAFLTFMAWVGTFMLLATIDEALGKWLTDHELTKILVQVIIQGVAVGLLYLSRVKFITAVTFNIVCLVFMWVFMSEGIAPSMAIIMHLGLIPIYLRERR